jgi:hypothetical protein
MNNLRWRTIYSSDGGSAIEILDAPDAACFMQANAYYPLIFSRRHVKNTYKKGKAEKYSRGFLCSLVSLSFGCSSLSSALAFCIGWVVLLHGGAFKRRTPPCLNSQSLLLLRRNRDSNSPLGEQPQWRLYLFFKRTLLANNETTLQFLHSH